MFKHIPKMDSDDDTKYSFETTNVKFKQLTDKLVKDGKTAILTNSKWGLNIEMFRCDPVIINLILEKKKFNREGDIDGEVEIFNDNVNKKIVAYCGDEYNFGIYRHENFWPNCLTVHWIPVNTFFRVSHCGDDGESIITIQEDTWTKA